MQLKAKKVFRFELLFVYFLLGWIADIKAYNKLDSFDYPIIADPDRTIANTYGMMDPDELDSKG